VLTHASIVCEGMLASVNSVNSVNFLPYTSACVYIAEVNAQRRTSPRGAGRSLVLRCVASRCERGLTVSFLTYVILSVRYCVERSRVNT